MADSLLSQPDLRKANDPKRNELIRLANLVIDQDPEFILKVRFLKISRIMKILVMFILGCTLYTKSFEYSYNC